MTSMCYMSDFRRGKGYCVIIANGDGSYSHGIELGKHYFKAAQALSEWAEANGWKRAFDGSPAWFKEVA